MTLRLWVEQLERSWKRKRMIIGVNFPIRSLPQSPPSHFLVFRPVGAGNLENKKMPDL